MSDRFGGIGGRHGVRDWALCESIGGLVRRRPISGHTQPFVVVEARALAPGRAMGMFIDGGRWEGVIPGSGADRRGTVLAEAGLFMQGLAGRNYTEPPSRVLCAAFFRMNKIDTRRGRI